MSGAPIRYEAGHFLQGSAHFYFRNRFVEGGRFAAHLNAGRAHPNLGHQQAQQLLPVTPVGIQQQIPQTLARISHLSGRHVPGRRLLPFRQRQLGKHLLALVAQFIDPQLQGRIKVNDAPLYCPIQIGQGIIGRLQGAAQLSHLGVDRRL
ncbi:MAG TPA: hypothetical protein VLS26_07005 [Azonexus sp.]|nr:hypothetical protein [Azonexus sp.]